MPTPRNAGRHNLGRRARQVVGRVPAIRHLLFNQSAILQ
jgi:hypothetical protein